MGAVSVTNRKEAGRYDNRRVVEADLALSASYATGGDTLSPAALGLRHIVQIEETSHSPNGSGRPVGGKAVANLAAQSGASLQVDLTSTAAPKIKLYDAQSTEIANATDLAARGPFRVRVIGY